MVASRKKLLSDKQTRQVPGWGGCPGVVLLCDWWQRKRLPVSLPTERDENVDLKQTTSAGMAS